MKFTYAILGLLTLLSATSARLGDSARNLKTYPIEDKPSAPKNKKKIGRAKDKPKSPLIPSFGQDSDGDSKVDNGAQSRIVGGEPAKPEEFPFFVDFGGCGASLIHEDIVVSAAHCAIALNYTSVLYVGAFREESVEAISRQNGGGFETRNIVDSVVHPEYDDFLLQNDIMVIKIDAPSRHKPVSINGDSDSPATGASLTAIGHGLNDAFAFEGTSVLHRVDVPAVSHEECVADFAALSDFEFQVPPGFEIVEDIMLCAGLDEGGKDSCQGDSGGPLLLKVGDSYEQVGVTSFGNGCGLPNSPGVYTRISGVKEWLDEQICILSDNPPPRCGEEPRGGCHLDNTSDEDCPPLQVSVRAVPPAGDAGAFDWDAGSTAVYYSHFEHSSAICKEYVYKNQNGLSYSLVAEQDLECPESITLEAIGTEVSDWDQTISSQLPFTMSESREGKFYCTYDSQNFAARLSRCQTSPLEGQTTILVDVIYDDYPIETGWSISQNDVVLVSREQGSIFQSGFLSERVYLEPGEYIFTMTDSASDGICCDFGSGSWQILAEVQGNDPILAEHNGVFTDETSATFIVPEPGAPVGTTPSPVNSTTPSLVNTTEPTCNDSETDTFIVDGEHLCSWLTEGQVHLQLCRFTDVALTCPKTCDICDHLLRL